MRRWRVLVELTWDIEDQELVPQYAGDAEVDYAWRSFGKRVRPQLEQIIHDGRVAHYHIIQAPRTVEE